MPLQKQTFVEVFDNLSKVIDVDDGRGRSVPKNMNFIEEGYLAKDTGCEYFGDTSTDTDIHSIFRYEKKNGSKYTLRVKGKYLQSYNSGTEVFDNLWGGVATITVATPAVVSITAHGFVAGTPIVFSTTGALPTGVTAGTTYYVIATDLTANTFKFSTTVGGSAVNTTGTQSGTHSVFAAFTEGARFGYVVYDDELYMCNAVESFMKWNGTTFTTYASAPKGNSLEIFEDRMFVTGVTAEPLTIYYTDAGTVTTFPGPNVLKPLGTDYVKAMVNYYGTLLIFKQDSIWKLTFVYDQVVALFLPKLELQSKNYGVASRKSVVWVENDLWFFTGREIRSIGYQDQQIGILGVNQSVISESIKETLYTVSFENYSQACVFYYDRRFYVSVPIGTGVTANNTTFVCHTLYENNWTKYDNRIKASNQDYMEIDGVVYTASSANPYGLLKWTTSLLNDDDEAISCEVFFDRIEDKDFNKFTFYRYLDLMFKDLTARVTVTILTDASDTRAETAKTFTIGSVPVSDEATVGEVPFGEMVWAEGYGYTIDFSPFQKRRISFLEKAQTITIGLSNDKLSETFTLVQMAISGHRKPRKMFKPSSIVSM